MCVWHACSASRAWWARVEDGRGEREDGVKSGGWSIFWTGAG